jgi:hypothetical protein
MLTVAFLVLYPVAVPLLSARYAIGSDVELVLPPALCWAYPARESGDASDA